MSSETQNTQRDALADDRRIGAAGLETDGAVRRRAVVTAVRAARDVHADAGDRSKDLAPYAADTLRRADVDLHATALQAVGDTERLSSVLKNLEQYLVQDAENETAENADQIETETESAEDEEETGTVVAVDFRRKSED